MGITMAGIKYKFKNIEEKQFACFPDNFKEESDTNGNAKLEFSANIERSEVKCRCKVELKQEDTLLLVTEIECTFALTKDSWEDIGNNQYKLPVDFMRHLVSLVIGTERGIIFAKTENTPLRKIILPSINLKSIVKDDLIVEQKTGKE